MGKWQAAAIGVATLAMGIGQAQAATCLTGASRDAAELRQLDVMLLVSSLRCRLSGVDFRPEYDRFLASNRDQLGIANRTILSELAPDLGAQGASDALDRLSVALANHYGQDSATAPCAQLKVETAALASRQSEASLLAVADRLIGADVTASACAIQYAER